jgi:hypothetical protein
VVDAAPRSRNNLPIGTARDRLPHDSTYVELVLSSRPVWTN